MIELKQGLDIVSDIHSCYVELFNLVVKLGYETKFDEARFDFKWFHPEGRVLVFVGDYMDRGPYPLETFDFVRRMMEDGIALGVQGNHCNKLKRYLTRVTTGKSVSGMTTGDGLQGTIDAIKEVGLEWEVLAWLNTLPLSIQVGSVLVTHGAWKDNVTENKLTDLNLYGETVVVKDVNDPNGYYHERVDRWKYTYNGSLSHIVVGHTIYDYPQIIKSKSGCKVVSIDTGAFAGGKLTAYRLNPNGSEEFVHERAREAYWP